MIQIKKKEFISLRMRLLQKVRSLFDEIQQHKSWKRDIQ